MDNISFPLFVQNSYIYDSRGILVLRTFCSHEFTKWVTESLNSVHASESETGDDMSELSNEAEEKDAN